MFDVLEFDEGLKMGSEKKKEGVGAESRAELGCWQSSGGSGSSLRSAVELGQRNENRKK